MKTTKMTLIICLLVVPQLSTIAIAQPDSTSFRSSYVSGYVNFAFTQRNTVPLNAHYDNGFITSSIMVGVNYSQLIRDEAAVRLGVRLGNRWSEEYLDGVHYRLAETVAELPVSIVKYTKVSEGIPGMSVVGGFGAYVATIIEQNVLPEPSNQVVASSNSRNGPFAYWKWGFTGDAGLRMPVGRTTNAILGMNVFWDIGAFMPRDGVVFSPKHWTIGIFAGTEF